MKIKKITCSDLEKGQLALKVMKLEFKQRIAEMKSKHTTLENMTNFYFRLDQLFKEEQEELLLVLGDHKADWKKYLRQEAKSHKKKVLLGDCFVEEQGDGSLLLNLVPLKGSARLGLIKKQGKALFRKYGVELKVIKAKKVVKELADEESQAILDQDNVDVSAVEQLADLTAEAKDLKALFKSLKGNAAAIQGLLELEHRLALMKTRMANFEVQLEGSPQLEKAYRTVQKLQAKLEKAVDKYQDKLVIAKQKVRQQLQTLIEDLNGLLQQENKGEQVVSLHQRTSTTV